MRLQSFLTTQLLELHRELGISDQYSVERGLPFHGEAQELVVADSDPNGTEITLTPGASFAWNNMKQLASKNGITLWLEYGFRGFEFQAELIRNEMRRGSTLENALTWIAAPGFSEHHSGNALDIACPECFPTTQAFEHTPAFEWLKANASEFGFSLSYPRGNPYGIIFEPWHRYYNA